MKILDLQNGIELLISLINKNAIVPIIGSGFTGGSPAAAGSVPMTRELETIMRKCILSHIAHENEKNLLTYNFDNLSEMFMDEDIVPICERLSIIKSYFTDVKVAPHKAKFLKIWKYIYTINIDDGIENATEFKTVLSYSALREQTTNLFKDKQYVLKLHGDAQKEIEIDKTDNIIFSPSQYIASLRAPEHANILASVRSDYKQKNLIFIGCSLRNEIDLAQIYKEVKSDILSTDIIYLCSKRPSANDEKRLSKYGINTLLIVNNYDSFYSEMYSAWQNRQINEEQVYKFINPKIEILNSKKEILKLFSFGRQTFDVAKGKFYVPKCKATRNIYKNMQRALISHDFIFIKGRRLSGKTILIQSLISGMPNYTSIYFPSEYIVDNYIANKLLDDYKNTLFIFDSNSLCPELYALIISQKNKISINKNKVIIASNTNEDYLVRNLNAHTEILLNTFDQEELDEFNEEANKFAFIKWQKTYTSLDYSYKLMNQHNLHFPLDSYNIDNMSCNQKALLYMLVIFDRIYSHEIVELGINLKEANDFIESYPILFEKIECSPYEADGKSIYKIVHNSKFIAINMISKIDKDDLSNAVTLIVKNLYIYDPKQYKGAIMFDNLNQIFSKDGAAYLIEYLYGKLESILYNEPHFWLQRAKSIYRLFKTDQEKLQAARVYAIKPLSDPNIDQYTKAKAAFTLSLIYCLLYFLEDDHDQKMHLQIKAIEYAHSAIVKNLDMAYSIKNELSKKRDRPRSAFTMLMEICDNFITPENSRAHYIESQNALDIISKLKEINVIPNNYIYGS